MKEEFDPKYALVASDSMDLVVKIARFVGKQYMSIIESIRQSIAESEQ
ncbi:MAG: hypothetical protein ACKOCQ_00670 [Candidatus Nitrosotenuis sp.]